jgi:multidrug efflux pump subunit AcrB
MTIVLIAVYIPIGFQGGLTGSLFSEFAFTLAGAVAVSALIALTLSPMMCARFFKMEHEGNNRLVQISDIGPSSTGTTLAYAGVNQNFRGIRFGPAETTVVARPTLSITPNGNSVIVQWNGAFVLQSATNVGGPYSAVVPTASSPYTNVTAPGQMFFRLRN